MKEYINVEKLLNELNTLRQQEEISGIYRNEINIDSLYSIIDKLKEYEKMSKSEIQY